MFWSRSVNITTFLNFLDHCPQSPPPNGAPQRLVLGSAAIRPDGPRGPLGPPPAPKAQLIEDLEPRGAAEAEDVHHRATGGALGKRLQPTWVLIRLLQHRRNGESRRQNRGSPHRRVHQCCYCSVRSCHCSDFDGRYACSHGSSTISSLLRNDCLIAS